MTVEDRVRDAFETAANTLGGMPALELPVRKHGHRRWAIPVAVAVSVAAIVAGMTTVTGRAHHQPTAVTSPQPAFSIGPALRPAGPPRFIVAATTAIVHDATGPNWKSIPPTYTVQKPVVLDANTGRVLFTIPMPAGWWSSWHQVAAAPDNRTFVLSAVLFQPDPRPTASQAAQNPPIRLFTLHLDENGRPGAPHPVPGFRSDGGQGIALSPDGGRVAYLPLFGAQVIVIDATTGQHHAWPVPKIGMAMGLSWLSDGHSLALVTPSGMRIIDATRPKSTTKDMTVPGLNGRTSINAGQLTPDGKDLIAAVSHSSPISPDQSWTELVRIPLGGGTYQPIARIPTSEVSAGNFAIDGTGHFLIFTRGWNINRVDLTTGRIRSFSVPVGERQGKGDSPGLAW